jgi:xanthine dehydrogenase iron-sulfur cluster and FAD-binding subunit A
MPDGLHPVQKAMVDRYGSQCGYCTPGFIVSMFEAYYRTDLADTSGDTRAKIGDQLAGNLCRCTGYRPIRDAMLDSLEEKKRRSRSTKSPSFLRQLIRLALETDSDSGGMRISMSLVLRSWAAPAYIM